MHFCEAVLTRIFALAVPATMGVSKQTATLPFDVTWHVEGVRSKLTRFNDQLRGCIPQSSGGAR